MKTILPRKFKIIGYAIPLLLILVMILVKFLAPDLMTEWSPYFKGKPEIFFAFLNIGLLIVILSKDKVEDERIWRLRLDSIAFAFLFGVSQVVLSSLGIWEVEYFDNSAYIMGIMLGVYLMMFEARKRFTL